MKDPACVTVDQFDQPTPNTVSRPCVDCATRLWCPMAAAEIATESPD